MGASARHIPTALDVLVKLRMPTSFSFMLLIDTVYLDVVADVNTAVFVE